MWPRDSSRTGPDGLRGPGVRKSPRIRALSNPVTPAEAEALRTTMAESRAKRPASLQTSPAHNASSSGATSSSSAIGAGSTSLLGSLLERRQGALSRTALASNMAGIGSVMMWTGVYVDEGQAPQPDHSRSLELSRGTGR